MSRFLFATMPVPGHVVPMVPIARALRERGDEVVWYGSDFLRSKVDATGATFVPISSTLDYGDFDYERHFPERIKHKDFAQIKFDFRHLFIDPIEGYISDMKAILRDFPADVILGDPAVVAGKIISRAGGDDAAARFLPDVC